MKVRSSKIEYPNRARVRGPIYAQAFSSGSLTGRRYRKPLVLQSQTRIREQPAYGRIEAPGSTIQQMDDSIGWIRSTGALAPDQALN